ncbi:ASCH domain-containing protein [Companilactobacillus ginsenosidimutans]|uniref:RNA-binding protein n=1 Tax=Companilactobacillus ginsenosidimutans TaxID=1007676 RepID=A0A0H4QLM2_9LACO|nr:ASCH domain-containing protein [Companilactobacillus ginsenosidimutans]AKP67991.1 RNA-binding protein [Companilactobacillus ginsenosidimutans]
MTTEEYWKKFCEKTGTDVNKTHVEWAFGYTKEVANDLLELVKKGDKRATTSAWELYEPGDYVPKVGDYNIILDGDNNPGCITQTKVSEVVTFDHVTAEHAYLEGEGDKTLKYWKKVHTDFFEKEYKEEGKVFNEEIQCLCEYFEIEFI